MAKLCRIFRQFQHIFSLLDVSTFSAYLNPSGCLYWFKGSKSLEVHRKLQVNRVIVIW